MADQTSCTKAKLEDILGSERLNDIAVQESEEGEANEILTNAKEISCECNTLILRPRHAKLILPTDSMTDVEKHLNSLQHGDKMFKNLVKSCYWLVDDMYKFEQISYTKEIKTQVQAPSSLGVSSTTKCDDSSPEQAGPATIASMLPGLRFLACAECNKCPLGWFDPRTKESYLYVW